MRRDLFFLAFLLLCGLGLLYFLSRWQHPYSVAPQNISTATTSVESAPPALHAATVHFANGKTIHLNIPSNYSITLAAQGFRAARFMAWSPDHRLFLGEMTNASDTHTGRVLVLDGFDPATGAFAATHTYAENMRNPNSVAFYRDPQGQEWIYVALTDKLLRYTYAAGDNAPTAPPEILATFPDSGPTPTEGGWHITRTLAFHGDTLFVSVGSGCNSCEETGVTRADILAMNPDGSNNHLVASGMRNAVGIIYGADGLYATANEADHLGNDRPNDLVYKVQDGTNYGWPYCYQHDGAIYRDTTQAWKTPYDCARVPLAFAELEAHSAPLGLEYFDDTFADAALRGSFLVAEHGSGKPSIGTGYMVSLVRSGTVIPFITGFLLDGARQARPVDIVRDGDRSFLVTDDFNGAVYYLRYNGAVPTP